MALQKTPVTINFSKGLETKADPYQIPVGNFLELTNSVFTVTGRLTKRNGFDKLTTLPNTDQTIITTLNDNLVATGTDLYTYSADTNQWINQGIIQPVQLQTQTLVRNSTSQTSPDIAINSNGLAALAYMDSGNSYYHVVDSLTGQQIRARTQLPATATNPRVFILGPYFIITFIATVAATPTLQFIAVNMSNPATASIAITISTDVNNLTSGYDAVLASNRLYIAWGASAATVKYTLISSNLTVAAEQSIAGNTADIMSVIADTTNLRIYITYWEDSSNDGYSASFNYGLAAVMAPTQVINNIDVREITSIFANGVLNIYYETINTYSYSTATSDYISSLTVTPPIGAGVGTASAPVVMLRSVGLASKAFLGIDGVIYMMVAYGDIEQADPDDNSNQPTYFLVDSTGVIYMNLAYSNGGGYQDSNVLPNITIIDDTYYFPYQITDFLTTVNKGTNLPAGTPSNAIYTQTGISLAKFQLNSGKQYSSEIAGALHLTGGQLWEFDGVKPVEHGFHVWPENILVSTSPTGGSIEDQQYFYVFTYEWTDNQGNLHRSAPSIPFTITTTGGDTSTNTIDVPTLRLTAKISPNPVRIVGYRWSVAQQVYYQFTSVTTPYINNTAVDSIEITDTLADSAILGNTLLYTTGGVLENIAAPASVHSALFDNRLWLIDAEDPNILWYSKQVIQNVPVEMSDLLTVYVAPTTGAQQSTGPSRCLSAMDDKLIIFKDNALYYINGSGPDNTGANSTYSPPIFITGVAGSNNPNSLVLIPQGIMYQSNKGIWLLGRDLSTKYIGSPVERYNDQIVLSSEVIPNTNQVRFVMSGNITLMYDYYMDQWGVHTNIKAISAVIYQQKHTYLNIYGQVYQESATSFKDGSEPVLLGLTTSWIAISGLQGFERFYFANLLGTYYTPFKLQVTLAYDYNSSATQSIIVLPTDNPAQPWGDEALWGSGPEWGGSQGNVFSSRIFPERQKCQSFQVTIQEVFDPSYGQSAGAGLSL